MHSAVSSGMWIPGKGMRVLLCIGIGSFLLGQQSGRIAYGVLEPAPSCQVSRVEGLLKGFWKQSLAVMVSATSAGRRFSCHIFIPAKQQASLTGFGKEQKEPLKRLH